MPKKMLTLMKMPKKSKSNFKQLYKNSLRITKDSVVRFRVMSSNIHEGIMVKIISFNSEYIQVVIGTLADDYLGLKSNRFASRID